MHIVRVHTVVAATTALTLEYAKFKKRQLEIFQLLLLVVCVRLCVILQTVCVSECAHSGGSWVLVDFSVQLFLVVVSAGRQPGQAAASLALAYIHKCVRVYMYVCIYIGLCMSWAPSSGRNDKIRLCRVAWEQEIELHYKHISHALHTQTHIHKYICMCICSQWWIGMRDMEKLILNEKSQSTTGMDYSSFHLISVYRLKLNIHK